MKENNHNVMGRESEGQAGHVDGRNTEEHGRRVRVVPMSFGIVPLSKAGRK